MADRRLEDGYLKVAAAHVRVSLGAGDQPRVLELLDEALGLLEAEIVERRLVGLVVDVDPEIPGRNPEAVQATEGMGT